MSEENLSGKLIAALSEVDPRPLTGRVRSVSGLVITASVPGARVGDMVEVTAPKGALLAQVVGINQGAVTLLPLGETTGIGPNSEVTTTNRRLSIQMGDHLMGRVLDGLGRPIDGKGPPDTPEAVDWPVMRTPPPPLSRGRIERSLPLGIRAIDAFCTLGEGQRIGIFAGSGVGKSTLLAQIARDAEADVVVIGLVGERGREVRAFLEDALGEEGQAKSVVVAATSDEPPLIRLHSAYTATAVAEWFRDQGRRVLLLMDSLTRFARAQRDVGLAVGEVPSRRGYPPSVFTTLPKLLERSGNNDVGSITAVYTVLVASGDLNEPVADEVRGLLDGHIVLSRALAERNHWPAIDVLKSLSRAMPTITTEQHVAAASRCRRVLARYEEKRDSISLGAYREGSDPFVDEAIGLIQEFEAFLQQPLNEPARYQATIDALQEIVGL